MNKNQDGIADKCKLFAIEQVIFSHSAAIRPLALYEALTAADNSLYTLLELLEENDVTVRRPFEMWSAPNVVDHILTLATNAQALERPAVESAARWKEFVVRHMVQDFNDITAVDLFDRVVAALQTENSIAALDTIFKEHDVKLPRGQFDTDLARLWLNMAQDAQDIEGNSIERAFRSEAQESEEVPTPPKPQRVQYGQQAAWIGRCLVVCPLRSNAGWYLGTFDEEGPCSRESLEYFPSEQSALAALENGEWTQRSEAGDFGQSLQLPRQRG